MVGEVIKKRFGVGMSLSQVRRTLRKLGFSVQYPRQRLSKADQERRRTWVEVELPAIKKKVREDDGIWIYGDEASFEQSGTICRHWAEKGVE